mmetsp:Transcript_80417/g.247988  ORF Transcript_80417/g.247988 Transcript_80417/m.247988 type:complete len:245 (-) Transcript_80417:545-1279(-)
MVPKRSPARSLVPELVLQGKLLVGRVGTGRDKPAVAPAARGVEVAHKDLLGHFVRERLATEALHGHCQWSVRPLDLRVEHVLLLQGAECELCEGLALVGHNAPVRAGLVRQAACREARQTLQAARLREAHPELILAALDRTAGGLQGRNRLLLLHGGELLQHAIYERKDCIYGFLSSAPLPEVLDVPPQLRSLGPAAQGGAETKGPFVVELGGRGPAKRSERAPVRGHGSVRRARDEEARMAPR